MSKRYSQSRMTRQRPARQLLAPRPAEAEPSKRALSARPAAAPLWLWGRSEPCDGTNRGRSGDLGLLGADFSHRTANVSAVPG